MPLTTENQYAPRASTMGDNNFDIATTKKNKRSRNRNLQYFLEHILYFKINHEENVLKFHLLIVMHWKA